MGVCFFIQKSRVNLTYFAELKHGLPGYQNKQQRQTINQTKAYYTSQHESEGFWDCWLYLYNSGHLR